MAKVRLYIYSSHDGGQTYVYDTGVFDSSAPPGAGCLNPDARQFASIQDVLAYAAGRGETVQQVSSVAEVNAICSGGIPSGPVVSQVQGLAPSMNVGGCSAGICGPTAPVSTVQTGSPGPTGSSVVGQGGGASTYISPANPLPILGGGSPNPFSSNLPGIGANIAGSAGGAGSPSGSQSNQAGQTAPVETSFNVVQFAKGPLGILTIILVLTIAILAGGKHG